MGRTFPTGVGAPILLEALQIIREGTTPPRHPQIPSIAHVAGVFASSLLRLEVSVDDDGELHMSLALRSGDEIVASDGIESCRLGVLSGDRGEFLVLDGALEGLMGAFVRDANGTVTELSLDTRLHQRAV